MAVASVAITRGQKEMTWMTPTTRGQWAACSKNVNAVAITKRKTPLPTEGMVMVMFSNSLGKDVYPEWLQPLDEKRIGTKAIGWSGSRGDTTQRGRKRALSGKGTQHPHNK